MRHRPLLLTLAALALPAPASAQQFPSTRGDDPATSRGDALAAVAQELQTDPVYVDAEAENAISGSEERRLRERISAQNAGPMYIAVVPGALRDRAGGDAAAVARQIARSLRREGVYAVIAGNQFRAGNVGRGLERGVAAELATEAFERRRDAGAAPVLAEFVDLVGKARRNGGASPVDHRAPGGGGAGALGLLALLGGGVGLLAWRSRRRRRREEEAQVAELRETARDDLVALGDDIRALDLDVQMPDVDEEGKHHYGQALERYERAERALDHARHPGDFAAIGQALEEGRFAMAAAKARLEGREVPEHRPPCFFDPRHGPSTREVLWAPDGYGQRPVPVCEADALRLEEGGEPMTREVLAGGRRVPLYDAPGFYAPYAGGFFGGFTGFLPGLLFGSLLGSSLGGFGGFGGLGAGTAYGDSGDLGDGGLDFGDFGGGGDFGAGGSGGWGDGGGDF